MEAQIRAALLLAAAFVLTAGALPAAAGTLAPEEAARWKLYLTPLPKKVEITGAISLERGSVELRAPGGEDAILKQTVREMNELLGEPAGSAPGFTIVLQMGGPEAEDLKGLKNSGQAYSISPLADSRGLKLTALTPTGLFYAWKTLEQLVRSRSEGGHLTLPVLRVLDWPDMEDRGLWGTDNWRHLKWMAARKMNIVEQISTLKVDEKGGATAGLQPQREPMVEEAPLYGMKAVPVVLHLEQLEGTGLFRAYPGLRGKSEHKGVICYSRPEFREILRDWIVSLASLPNVHEIDVWMTENLWPHTAGCECDECRQEDWAVLEARTIIAAWRMAREKRPDLGLRILTSEATEDSNQAIFRELPPEVKIWYYHSLLTYCTSRDPMLRPYLAETARAGRWVGVCPNLVAAVNTTQPFTSPQFVHGRMKEFLEKGMSGLIGYATPRVQYSYFNVEAAAEWGWNLNGRTPRDFALSWAVRQGLKDPEKFAEWCETLGEASWEVYGSDWPAGEQRSIPGKSAERLLKGTLPPLGFVLWDAFRLPWGDIKSAKRLEENLTNAGRAVRLAREMGRPEFYFESLYIQGHLQALKALYELRSLVRDGRVEPDRRDEARRWFREYIRGLEQAADVLPRWEATVYIFPGDVLFTEKPVNIIRGMISEMKEVARRVGCQLD